VSDEVLALLGKRVRTHRRAAGLSQADLAWQVDLTRSSIANLECGRQDISVTRLVGIAAVLNVTPADLLKAGEDATQDQLVLQRILNRNLATIIANVETALHPNLARSES